LSENLVLATKVFDMQLQQLTKVFCPTTEAVWNKYADYEY